MPQIIIHRGTKTIGGSCIEISSGSCRIILDIGMPLMTRDGGELDKEAIKTPSVENGILPDVKGLYQYQTPSVDAVILSHAHMDHYGLMDWVHPDIPIYLSKESEDLIKVGNVFYPPEISQGKILNHCHNFNHWKPFKLGPFSITSYLMDHSGFGASSLLIEVGGKRIFYTGDLRGHGRKAKLFERLVAKPITKIDCMLMEGTTIGGGHDLGYSTEEKVEEGMYKLFSTPKDTSFVMAAGSNIDRLVSIYKAAGRAKKTLVIDLYQVYLLEKLKKASRSGLPPHPGDFIRVLYLKRHADAVVKKLGKQVLYEYKSRKINQEEILNRREEMVLRLPLSIMSLIANKMIEKQCLHEANFIYSMWPGYLKRDPKFRQFSETYKIPITKIHTSGHAYLDDLKRLSKALNPMILLPIHTLHGDDFQNHFANVVRIQDGEAFQI